MRHLRCFIFLTVRTRVTCFWPFNITFSLPPYRFQYLVNSIMYKEDFNAYVGSKSGVFKGVQISKKACITKNLQSLVSITDGHQMTQMAWGDNNEKEILLACGKNEIQSVRTYDTENLAFTSTFHCDVGSGGINGISRCDSGVLTAVESGHVTLWTFSNGGQLVVNAGENLHRMKHDKTNKNIIATGGLEHELKLFDLETQKQTFVAKNVPHDWLQLRVPVSISDIEFLPNSTKVVTVGKFGHIRLYDPTSQRRPVINLEIKETALTCLATCGRERHIIVGSGRGTLNLIDLRNAGRVLNSYKGCTGGITAIVCSNSEPVVVSSSLDRHLRIHHLETKELLRQVYLTSKLTCMVVRSNFGLEENDTFHENANKNEDIIDTWA
ncbi:WD repeat-containing protein 74 [Orussus abietinus]|uniref:WD repeat-containing protein 74 n=1 Tax=Orussus abietinus TaxID=222816 RepID=UPI000626E62F|nr:WD repeat-containing protein 74 [Orussus abietinus]